MSFTDIFIRRPVLATVISLLILLLGVRALMQLQVREYPEILDTEITITTAYPGASADLIQGFITTPIQQAIASAEGIDYITANSSQNVSQITVKVLLNYDPNKALMEVMNKAAEVRNALPAEAQEPVIQKASGGGSALMYLSFFSEAMNGGQITDYLTRVVQPKLETLDGVAKAELLGGKTFAMRVWLNPDKLAALGVTPAEVALALRSNSYLSAAGQTKGELVAFNITADTNLQTVEAYKQLVVKRTSGSLVRLSDLASIELGAESYDSSVIFSGQKAVFFGIYATPSANPLEVIDRVRAALPGIQGQLPSALQGKIVYDATEYIRSSIYEVIITLGEAALIVVLVIFLFIGSVRAVIIPVVTIPLSMIGVGLFMLFMGYSINLLTLLAMVLAIGLVVDDAIVVVENINRHIEEGKTPMEASLEGAREIAMPVVAMTITLAAVYAPIGFMGGLTGGLFKEFALTLAGAVLISGVIALTLSPMMCSKILSSHQGAMMQFVDRQFTRLKNRYQSLLHGALDYKPVTGLMIITILVSCYFLYMGAKQELAPPEDQGFLLMQASGPQNATHEYMTRYTDKFNDIFKKLPETGDYFIINGMGTPNVTISGQVMKPWTARSRSQMEVQPELQNQVNGISGLSTAVFSLPRLPGASGLPIQFVINTTNDYKMLYEVSQKLLEAVKKSGKFIFIDSDLKFDNRQISLMIDRSKAAELGVSMADIGNTLGILLGGGYTNRFNMEGRSYKVIPQVMQDFRRDPSLLQEYRIKTADGSLVPLSTVIKRGSEIQPNQLNQFQQLNSATLSGVMMPGVSTGEALAVLQSEAKKLLPQGYGVDYMGQSRQFMQEGNALLYAFLFAILIIFLVLAAQFESFRDPLVVLFSVPMSLCGALIFINLGFSSINIYTQVGLVTLIGLISKHGILMVEFANELQIKNGLNRRAAIEEAAGIRLRAILMTTGAMVLGVLPLLLADGPGAVSRFDIGLTIAAGMGIGTLFTLFVVPTMYLLLGQRHPQEQAAIAEPSTPPPASLSAEDV